MTGKAVGGDVNIEALLDLLASLNKVVHNLYFYFHLMFQDRSEESQRYKTLFMAVQCLELFLNTLKNSEAVEALSVFEIGRRQAEKWRVVDTVTVFIL